MVAMDLDNPANEQEILIHQDVLEPILSYVPLIDLAPASLVSKTWRRSVHDCLRYLREPKPWFLVHNQSIWSPKSSTTHAYDPRSDVWMKIKSTPSTNHALRSSDSNLLYAMAPMKFSFSMDPLKMTWHHVSAPTVWRDDAVVSLVGRKIIVVGGVCDFEDDDLAVESYDLDSGTWSTCRDMPESLRNSGMQYLLSVCSDGEQMYIADKKTGDVHLFHPEKNIWSGPHTVCPDPSVFFSVIALVAGQLILIGLEGGNVRRVRMWNVDKAIFVCELIGEMPGDLVEKLGRDSTIGVSYLGNLMYIYNPSEVEEIVTCEVGSGGALVWGRVRNVVQGRSNMNERVVCTCGEVGLERVVEAMSGERNRFKVVERVV